MPRGILVGVVLLSVVSFAALGCTVTTYTVTPDTARQVENVLVGWLRGARTSLDLVASSLTYGPIAAAVVDAADRGVTVRMILEASAGRLPEASAWTSTYEIPVALEETPAVLLHQFIVVDGGIVLVGPFSWLESPPQKVYMDLLAIDCRGESAAGSAAGRYLGVFEDLWSRFASTDLQESVAATTLAEPGTILLFHVDAAGECIELISTSATIVDIAGWAISDLEGRYVFPPETYLEPNEPFSVCISAYNPTYDSQGLYLNDDHDEVYLSTPEGAIVDEVIW